MKENECNCMYIFIHTHNTQKEEETKGMNGSGCCYY